jgi:hypothetical protein
MGNDIANFNAAYSVWAKYRAAVKYAKDAKSSQNKAPTTDVKLGQRPSSSEKNIPQKASSHN